MSNHNQNVIDDEVKAMAKRAVQFVNSTAGQQAIEIALEKARIVTAKLYEARKVDSKKLHDPMTI